ncbi:hypothetical protein CK203_044426 [Vitis vinifera]|uniref:CCHC-type domain-containing protein n=1 Tax=Vitis vinifera TaxID=29760 RepID=A0A438HUA5_VITVI|nr:hypothetical protein CK203_044426 [Vitis vinifera]
MWAYLKKVYHQDNDAHRFQLEHAITIFQHGSLSIQNYYSAFLTLWHEYADLVTTHVPIAALSTIQAIHATTRRDQFLMKLQEQRLSTQAILEQSHGSSGTTTIAYAAQGRGPPMHSKNLQCFCCKEYGHIAATCPKNNFCSTRLSFSWCFVPVPLTLDYCTPNGATDVNFSIISNKDQILVWCDIVV